MNFVVSEDKSWLPGGTGMQLQKDIGSLEMDKNEYFLIFMMAS